MNEHIDKSTDQRVFTLVGCLFVVVSHKTLSLLMTKQSWKKKNTDKPKMNEDEAKGTENEKEEEENNVTSKKNEE